MPRQPKQRKRRYKSALTAPMILAWADEYHREHGEWPNMDAGPIKSAPGETWHRVSFALFKGYRGLSGGMTLAGLLRERRGIQGSRRALDEREIFKWAQFHFQQTGRWPDSKSGPVFAAPGETWRRIHDALKCGRRGLPRGSSLAALLQAHGAQGVGLKRPLLTADKILGWADAYYQSHGEWPYSDSGAIRGSAGETWRRINTALIVGLRGLPGGSSLSILLNEYRGIFRGRKRRVYRTGQRSRPSRNRTQRK